MVNITKVYTKTGDDGTTGVAGNKRFNKDSQRICCIGDIDELNCAIGIAAYSMSLDSRFKQLQQQCQQIQQWLFNLGAQLAVLSADRRDNTPIITTDNIGWLERSIDVMNASLPALSSFILPAGGAVSVHLHSARAICRRGERALVTLAKLESLDGSELPFVNRLSDWLFVAARHAAQLCNETELLWLR